MPGSHHLRACVALMYLIQHSRVIPYGSAGRFERDQATGTTLVVLPLGGRGASMRIPINGTPPEAPAQRMTVVTDPDGSFQLLYTAADTEEEAETAMDESLIDYVLEEVGEHGMQRMVRQFLRRGPLARLNPLTRRRPSCQPAAWPLNVAVPRSQRRLRRCRQPAHPAAMPYPALGACQTLRRHEEEQR